MAQQSPDEFLLRPGAPHTASDGTVFALDAKGHKHAQGGGATGRWTLSFQRKGKKAASLQFTASAPEDFYGEAFAFDSFFRLMGEAPGGGVKIVLRPETKQPVQATSQRRSCDQVLEQAHSFALPAGVSLAGGASARKGIGACIFSPTDGSAVVVVGIYSLEVLHARRVAAPPAAPVLK
jgi:hypothetical protein